MSEVKYVRDNSFGNLLTRIGTWKIESGNAVISSYFAISQGIPP
jgi:hypothetical protein